jgi:hypothetical protein
MLEARQKRSKVWDGHLCYKNVWIWGRTGCGKSKWTAAQDDLQHTFRKMNNKWWDGYSVLHHRLVIIEDWPVRELDGMTRYAKIWADRYPFPGEIKGGGMYIVPGDYKLIVTSNYSIDQCFTRNPEDMYAIKRRFCEIKMTKRNKALILETRIAGVYGIEHPLPTGEEEEQPESPSLHDDQSASFTRRSIGELYTTINRRAMADDQSASFCTTINRRVLHHSIYLKMLLLWAKKTRGYDDQS